MRHNSKVRYQSVNSQLDLGTLIGLVLSGFILAFLWVEDLEANLSKQKPKTEIIALSNTTVKEVRNVDVEQKETKKKKVQKFEVKNKKISRNTYKKITLTHEPIPDIQHTFRYVYLETEPIETNRESQKERKTSRKKIKS